MPKEDSRRLSAEGMSVEQRQQILLEASASDVVIAEVARRHGINPDDLYRWRYAERQEPSGTTDILGFVEVGVLPENKPTNGLVRAHIQFSNDVSLILEGGVSLTKLTRVIELIEAP